ncbi:MAG: PIG-L family deacetylase [Ardenticatenaceae bacterium]|nr:PIG-L family deacetylase [Anaerolineales bacterium]MCB8921368.1 PIG-L family deacetylase [Ardenticatenaceae bacterium]MCB8991490.1 PIG-L family deacetylase [Ardenticatenaceae bacterium]MCB9004008.1 PIG-L family deacetylase [Ardenticatenaceae bacterium]
MTKRLLAVLAHPDDESFGPGGTFARYAAEGVDVHIAIATDGAAGSVASGYEEAREKLAEVRAGELETAVSVLGATLHTLGYRDSGYINDPANQHPEAFINADEYEAIGRVVRLIREIQPQVVVTHDETGNYFHPDHIFCWKITTPAFHAAGDPTQYPDIGPAPYQPQRLYYTAFPNTMIKFYTFLMRLRGQDPRHAGRNKDIDFTRLGFPRNKIHAVIDYRDYWDVKREASAKHASQGGGTGNSRALPEWFQRRFLARETYIRAVPPVPDGFRETDLFE